jgi:hypothetical protein
MVFHPDFDTSFHIFPNSLYVAPLTARDVRWGTPIATKVIGRKQANWDMSATPPNPSAAAAPPAPSGTTEARKKGNAHAAVDNVFKSDGSFLARFQKPQVS